MEDIVIRSSNNSSVINLGGKAYNKISFLGKGIRNITLTNGTVRHMIIGNFPTSLESFQKDYLTQLYASAPKNITLRNMTFQSTIEDNGSIYTRPGIQHLLVEDCRFEGQTGSITIYLNSECANITIRNNKFLNNTRREHIAIDGARDVLIENNLVLANRGFAYFYRNCGEGGRNRWTQPENCIVQKNIIHVSSLFYPAIMLNSRPERRCYCIDRDNGAKIPDTTSVNWRSEPTNNKIIDNSIIGGTLHQHIYPSAYPNEIRDNVSSIKENGSKYSIQPEYGLKHILVEQVKIQAFKYFCFFFGKQSNQSV